LSLKTNLDNSLREIFSYLVFMIFSCTKLIVIVLLLPVFSIAQTSKPKNSPKDFGFTTFKIKGSVDSISFIVSDTSFQRKKRLFLFSQGSLPTALFWKEDESHTWQQFMPFQYQEYLKDYDFVIISKPGIPVFAYTADKNYMYIDPVTKLIPQEYYDKSYLDYYVTQANDVINYLIKQKWVDKTKIVIAGHSQGSKVVSKLGAINKHVTQVVYLSGNPLGRYDQDIRDVRKEELLGKISDETAQKELNDLYARWEAINQKPDDTHSNGGDTNKAWTSFSTPLLGYLLKIDVPIFIGYGTVDNTADYCDLLPLDFIRLGKHNYTLKPYAGYDHNFNKVAYDKDGNKISSEPHWDEVAKDIFQWLKKQLGKN
jgi:pimeloyl-ACP methyl ester carboxylesterase